MVIGINAEINFLGKNAKCNSFSVKVRTPYLFQMFGEKNVEHATKTCLNSCDHYDSRPLHGTQCNDTAVGRHEKSVSWRGVIEFNLMIVGYLTKIMNTHVARVILPHTLLLVSNYSDYNREGKDSDWSDPSKYKVGLNCLQRFARFITHQQAKADGIGFPPVHQGTDQGIDRFSVLDVMDHWDLQGDYSVTRALRGEDGSVERLKGDFHRVLIMN